MAGALLKVRMDEVPSALNLFIIIWNSGLVTKFCFIY